MRPRYLVMLLALSAIWGSSFMWIKIGVRELSPATLVLGRVGIAALTLIPVVLVALGPRRALAELRRHWRPLFVVGALNSSVPFWLLSWSETRIDSGLAAIIQAAAPIFLALLALRFVPSERVGGWRLVGLLVGFAGVGLLVGVQHGGDVLAALAVVGTALCYAGGILYAGRRLSGVQPMVTALGTMTAATVLSVPAGIAQAPGSVPSAETIAAVLVLAVVCSAIAYILYFAIMAGAGASRAILITYLVPAVAVFYGAVFLSEPLTASSLAGLALILAGVALGTGAVSPVASRRARLRPPAPAPRRDLG
jgi:drug/metabolite transporter (DMT)-like permease